jgi:hypothetical protein
MHPNKPPDYSPAEIACPGNLVENSGNPVQTGVFDYIPLVCKCPTGATLLQLRGIGLDLTPRRKMTKFTAQATPTQPNSGSTIPGLEGGGMWIRNC